MKKLILILFFVSLLPNLMAEEEDGEKEKPLPEFYHCNNSSRHYCRTPEHAAIVDRMIKGMYKRKVRITPQIIKSLAQRHHP